jgi:DNA-binding protein YbaB
MEEPMFGDTVREAARRYMPPEMLAAVVDADRDPNRTGEAVAAAIEEFQHATYEGQSDDAAALVTVTGGGRVTSVDLGPREYAATNARTLAASIVQAYERATRRALDDLSERTAAAGGFPGRRRPEEYGPAVARALDQVGSITEQLRRLR